MDANIFRITPRVKPHPLSGKSRRAALLPQHRDGSTIDKVTAASLAMWYGLPGTPYRVTVNFNHKFKEQSFGYLRDALTTVMRNQGIQFHWFSFELSGQGRLHCHGMTNIPHDTDIETLRAALQRRFGNSKEIRESLIGRNKIVHIDPVIHASHKNQGPEQWASYSMGDERFTKAHLRWETTHYISQSLKPMAKTVYEWLRNPDIDCLPFELVDVPPTEKANWFRSLAPIALKIPMPERIFPRDDSAPAALGESSFSPHAAPSEKNVDADRVLTVADLATAWNSATAEWIDRIAVPAEVTNARRQGGV